MGQYIDMYYAADNSRITEDGNYTNPVEFHLRIDQAEEKEVRLYLQTETNYTAHNLSVAINGTTSDKWALAPDNSGSPGTYGDYGAAVDLSSIDASAGKTYFWAKAKVANTEDIQKDRSVNLSVVGTVEPV